MGYGFRWGRSDCTSAGATFEASFEQTGVETDGEVLEFEVSLRFADWGDLVLKLLLQVEIKLIAEGLIVPVHILFSWTRILPHTPPRNRFGVGGGFLVLRWLPSLDFHR